MSVKFFIQHIVVPSLFGFGTIGLLALRARAKISTQFWSFIDHISSFEFDLQADIAIAV